MTQFAQLYKVLWPNCRQHHHTIQINFWSNLIILFFSIFKCKSLQDFVILVILSSVWAQQWANKKELTITDILKCILWDLLAAFLRQKARQYEKGKETRGKQHLLIFEMRRCQQQKRRGLKLYTDTLDSLSTKRYLQCKLKPNVT